MAKVIWLGEDALHKDRNGEPIAGPSYTMWNGVKFPKDVPVDVTNEQALAKARGNPFFDVIDDVAKTVKTVAKTAAAIGSAVNRDVIDGDKNS